MVDPSPRWVYHRAILLYLKESNMVLRLNGQHIDAKTAADLRIALKKCQRMK